MLIELGSFGRLSLRELNCAISDLSGLSEMRAGWVRGGGAGHKTPCSFPLSWYEIDDQRSVYKVYHCNPTKLTIKLFLISLILSAAKMPSDRHWPGAALRELVRERLHIDKRRAVRGSRSEGMYRELYAHKGNGSCDAFFRTQWVSVTNSFLSSHAIK